MDVNTCYVLTVDMHTLAYYTHLLPIFASVALAVYLLIRTKNSLLARVFFYFTAGFVVWLICDIVTWTTQNYYLVPFFWSLFDYTNVLFFLYGLYFLLVVARQQDISVLAKWLGLIITLPAAYLLISGQAVGNFDQATCGDGLSSDFLNTYKNVVQVFVMVGIFVTMIATQFSKRYRDVRTPVFVIGTALLLFFLTFTITDYWSVATNDYRIGLYGLLVMPLFLGLIVYSIVAFETFSAHVVGAQLLVFSLLALIAAGFLFVQSLTSQILVGLTLLMAMFFGVSLVRSVKLEILHREEIEKLAHTLDETNGRQETLIHFIGHEVKGFLTKDAGAFAALSEGDLGALPETAKPFVASALQQSRAGADSVANILKASNLKKGTVSYDKKPFDMKELVASSVERAKQMAADKKLELSLSVAEGSYQMVGDGPQINDHVLRNLIENALNYTPAGTVAVSLKNEGGKVIFSVKDSGVGITDEDKKRLFTEGGHGAESQKVNAHSTGYGLYIAKQIVDAHGGSIRAESEGAGKGSTFIAEFPVSA